MNKLSGKSGRIKIGNAIAITGAICAAGIVTVTAANALAPGMFVLISGVLGMVELNNSGKGHLVKTATPTEFEVELSTVQLYTSGGTATRIIPIIEFNLNRDSEVGDVTDSESGDWKENLVAGHKSWDGDYTGVMYDGDGDPPFAEELDAEFDIDETNIYSGKAIFKSQKTGVKINSTSGVAVTGTFTGTGALIKTLPA